MIYIMSPLDAQRNNSNNNNSDNSNHSAVQSTTMAKSAAAAAGTKGDVILWKEIAAHHQHEGKLVSQETRLHAARDAAWMGTLTRLQEHVVESVSREKAAKEDAFFLKSGLHMTTQRSSMFQIITEAAAMGSMKTKKTIEIVTNHSSKMKKNTDVEGDDSSEGDQEDEDEESPMDVDGFKYKLVHARSSTIETDACPTLLVGKCVELMRERRKKEINDAERALESLENHTSMASQFKTLELELPTMNIPKFKKPVSYMTDGRLRDAVVRGAVEMANSRQERLVLEGRFKFHQTCKCVYCKNPSPFQTQSYQKLKMKSDWSDDSLMVESSTQLDLQTAEAEESPRRRRRRRTTSTSQRQTLASALSATVHGTSSMVDPNLPSHFKDMAASQQQVRAWKTRAATAKRQSYSPTASSSLEAATMHSPSGTNTRPSWTTSRNSLKKAPSPKDPETRRKELEESRHQPAWSVGKKMLDPTVSPRRHRSMPLRRSDLLAQTEHSPVRAKTMAGRPSPLRQGRSFDGEIDEEQLLWMELERKSPIRRTMKQSISLDRSLSPAKEEIQKPSISLTASSSDDESDFYESEDDFAI